LKVLSSKTIFFIITFKPKKGKYTKLKQKEQENKENWDVLYQKMRDLSIPATDQEQIKLSIIQKESENLRKKWKTILF